MEPSQGVGALIELDHVTRRFGMGAGVAITALDDVSLTIQAGSAVALSGPSGSGKSTLLHLIAALDRPDEGSIVVGGTDVGRLRGRGLDAHRRRVGFVFQRFNLLPALTVIDNVIAPVLPLRTGFDKRRRAAELLGRVGLDGRADVMPSRLSGGEQQRVAIARALINHPALVLADEPTGNLDSHTGQKIIDLLLELREREAITLLVATHDVAVASCCDRVVRIVDGRVRDQIDVLAAADPEGTLARLGRPAPR
ncbi:MAG TPA: ABC transporter ATP-binding protein [Solirubrobacteraceae bacterium]|nr:ABC transporter ATP-binding protein [Solirubrobacteraceae bacterium]